MLKTKDLILRPGREGDWQDLYRNLWSREETCRFMFRKVITDPEHARAKTAAYVAMHRMMPTEFFVEEAATGAVIGIAGIKPRDDGCWQITDVAIGPDHWGKGYGRQIVLALKGLAFSQGAAFVGYCCFAENEASKALAAACGFAFHHAELAEVQKDGKDVTLHIWRAEI